MPTAAQLQTALWTLKRRFGAAAALAAVALTAVAQAAAPARVAVATNFAAPLKQLQAGFERSTGYRLLISAGSTGKLYAQITQGAPFDLFLAADQQRPDRLAAARRVVGEPFVYARGQLVLWTRQENQTPSLLRRRLESGSERLAIANERLAPYGLAAKQALTSMGIWAEVQSRLLRGENVGQAYALAATGNAPLALVAASLPRSRAQGSAWTLPAAAYEPVLQAAVLLPGGKGGEAASAFATHLRSVAAQAELERWGYLPLTSSRP